MGRVGKRRSGVRMVFTVDVLAGGAVAIGTARVPCLTVLQVEAGRRERRDAVRWGRRMR